MSRCRTRSRWAQAALVLLLAAGAALLYGGWYVFTQTQLLIYLLDHLHMRSRFLPPLTCANCSHFRATFTLGANRSCGSDVFLLILVTSHHANANARNMIRQTWGSVSGYKGKAVLTYFLFGRHADKNLNSQLLYEQNKYHDVIQGDFPDHYRTLTFKSLMGLQWSQRYCAHARYVLKTDDDSFNNPDRYIDYLSALDPALPFIGGYCFTVWPDRRKSSKFYVTEDQYPGHVAYPTYCAGPGYVLSGPAVSRVLSVSDDVRYLPMEDVFITGMCRQVAGLEYTQIPGVVVGWGQMTSCGLATWVKNTHNIVPGNMRLYWERAVRASAEDCVSAWVYVMGVGILLTLWCVWANRGRR